MSTLKWDGCVVASKSNNYGTTPVRNTILKI
jgi:hypothetical protein